MPRARRPRVQVCKKNFIGRCLLCDETDVTVLDAHRALDPGGRYDWGQILVCCASCHRKCHGGSIQIKGRFLRSDGARVWLVVEDGIERFVEDG